jgi:hypothetical protein
MATAYFLGELSFNTICEINPVKNVSGCKKIPEVMMNKAVLIIFFNQQA